LDVITDDGNRFRRELRLKFQWNVTLVSGPAIFQPEFRNDDQREAKNARFAETRKKCHKKKQCELEYQLWFAEHRVQSLVVWSSMQAGFPPMHLRFQRELQSVAKEMQCVKEVYKVLPSNSSRKN
jgi:hypothetical protein